MSSPVDGGGDDSQFLNSPAFLKSVGRNPSGSNLLNKPAQSNPVQSSFKKVELDGNVDEVVRQSIEGCSHSRKPASRTSPEVQKKNFKKGVDDEI